MTTENVKSTEDKPQVNPTQDGFFATLFNVEVIFIIATIGVVGFLMDMQFLDIFERDQSDTIVGFISTYFFPPETDPSIVENIANAMVETIQMALIGTYFGFLISLPLSLMAARNLMPNYISVPMRLLLSGIRTVPSLIWALLFVILFGLGPRSGTLALSFYTVGYLGKFQYETFEGLNSEPFEALRALGANKIQLVRFVAIPESANELISQAIFMFEYNIRSSSIIGFVGAGGIGYLMSFYLSFFQFHALLTALIFILVTVILIDFIGGKIREKFQDPNFQELAI